MSQPAAYARQVFLDEQSVSVAALTERAQRAAGALAAMGVKEGDTVALLLRNNFAFIEATLAATQLGIYLVPINWHGQAPEVRYVLDDCAPKVLIGHADLLQALGDALPAGLPVVAVPASSAAAVSAPVSASIAASASVNPAHRFIDWNTWLAAADPWSGTPPATRSSMIYTSGTTGKPKGVRRKPATPEQAVATAEMFKCVYGVRPGMRALVNGPLYHSSPNAFMRNGFAHAEVFVMHSRFDAETTLAAIARHRITHAVMVPTMFVRLLKLPPEVRARYDVSSLEWVTHTGAPCPVEVKKALIDWWGPVVVETYGSTEAGTATVCSSEDWLTRPGTAGRPTPGTRIVLYDEAGAPVPEGGTGEIYMRVPCYPEFTYHNKAEKRAEIERDGLISCGDIGYLKDGYLYLCDRRSDMVISGGVNIYPAEIESALVQSEKIRDCAVFGIPDDDLGESLAAAVELAPGASMSADEVKEFLIARLAKFKVPRTVTFHATLPREDSGKIFKRRLRDPYWEKAGRRI